MPVSRVGETIANYLQGPALGFIELAPVTGLEPAEPDRPDGDADEPERRISHGGGHPSDLSITSLAEGQAKPGGRNILTEPDRYRPFG